MNSKGKKKQKEGVTLIPVSFIEDEKGNRYRFVNEHVNLNANIFYGVRSTRPRLSIGTGGFVFAVGISKVAKGGLGK